MKVELLEGADVASKPEYYRFSAMVVAALNMLGLRPIAHMCSLVTVVVPEDGDAPGGCSINFNDEKGEWVITNTVEGDAGRE